MRCMIFKSKENQCTLQVLEILQKKVRAYGFLFKETKVSHTTLQSVLKYLVEKGFISKIDDGYKILDKGKILSKKLFEVKEITG